MRNGLSPPSPRPISKPEEKRIALALSPPVAWPTIALALLLPCALGAIVALGATGRWPLWACTPILALLSYAHYTLVHEAIHGNVVSKPKTLHWVNTLVGWIGALGLGGAWPILQRTHVLHHSHTNTERDPDLIVKGGLGQLVVKWAVMSLMSLIPLAALRFIAPSRYERLGKILGRAEIAQASAVTLAYLGLRAAAIAAGHGLAWLLLWYAPTRLAFLILNVFFQWLPHYPFDRTDRYGATRISLWGGGQILTLQQNLHLMHHLWPSVPFYNYARLFEALKPVLQAEGARIEGLAVGRWARSKVGELTSARPTPPPVRP
jgi:fatty acid desaturase